MNLSLVIPCLNEIEALPRMRATLSEFRRHNSQSRRFSSIEIIIVDDGSSDGTELELPRWSDCRVIRNPEPTGYGAALKAGFQAASGDVIGFLDMDSSYVANEFFGLADELQRRKLDCVFGCRTSQTSGMPAIRFIGNRLYAGTLRALCGSSLSDVCTGQRLFTRKLLPVALSLPQDDLSYSIALTVALIKNGCAIGELPVAYLERDGDSKLSVINDGLGFLWAIIRTKYGSTTDQYRRLH